MRLLIAEDDRALRDTLVRGLREEAYAVDGVSDGDAAFLRAVSEPYDAIVLDVLLPRRDGRSVCRALRDRGVLTPVLLLTALDGPEDTISGFDAGADDYLAKPFAFGVLLARLRALLRRRGELLPVTIVVADLIVDTRRRRVHRGDRVVPLTAREYSFLAYLARHSGRVVGREELAAHVWDDAHEPTANLIDVYVSRIRRKIDGDAKHPLLHTRRGQGVILTDREEDVP
ncbi:MAG: response regulator transcription factor [Gemmatimonadaceae bacterium]|jgi:DNA-binding response OmpR family regulator|nr:response regulator transcription factor [Gemmatimonadaceae bacterium]